MEEKNPYATISRPEYDRYVDTNNKRLDKIEAHLEANNKATQDISDSLKDVTDIIGKLATAVENMDDKISERIDGTDEKIEAMDKNIAEKISLTSKNTEIRLESHINESDLKFEHMNETIADKIDTGLKPVDALASRIDGMDKKKEVSTSAKVAIWTVLATSLTAIIAAAISIIPDLFSK